MIIPFEPVIFGTPVNVHFILEWLAFFGGFRYYVFLRKGADDPISNTNRLSIILGAVIGAFLGSRIAGVLENPVFAGNTPDFARLMNSKSIMGGLFGGLIGVETAKKIIGEKRSSGDLFTFPIILGIMIGRIGCFLSGTNEFTYGKETTFFTGMYLGDGKLRHPLALYEIVFLLVLCVVLRYTRQYTLKENGRMFQFFMIAYFGFRFCIEFIKPNIFFVFGLSSIQWLCILCWIYYSPTMIKLIRNAR
ncbi:MAG: prolipoprotein diacylglyceryl transferase [Mucilaginibacter polytrichastri]|nr:prolipoprotein diacylglyceryl transferase [Mucilaginibacter polytrichastri]